MKVHPKYKLYAIFLLLILNASSCWAPRCPISNCRSKYEHSHNALVSGIFSPRYGVPFKAHFLWDKDKGENNPNTEFVPGSSDTKNKKKAKKRYPWERW